MASRLSWLQTPFGVIALAVCLAAASMWLSIETRSVLAAAPLLVLLVPAVVYLALTLDPAAVLTAGVTLTFNSFETSVCLGHARGVRWTRL